MSEWEMNVLDHKWINLRKWVDCCEKNFKHGGIMNIQDMRRMMDTLDKHEKVLDDRIIEALCGADSNKSEGGK